MGQSFRGLAHTPGTGSLRDPGLTTPHFLGPCAVLTPGGTQAGEGTKLEEDNGIRGFVLWILGGGGQSPIPLSLVHPCPFRPCPGIETGASFLVVEGMGKMSAGQASTGQGA